MLVFNEYSVKPCLPSGETITSSNVKEWDGVTVKFETELCIETVNGGICLKPGFITDGGTIPRVFRNVINPHGKYAIAFYGHDGFYSSSVAGRKYADKWLYDVLELLGCPYSGTIYRTVRWFGGSHYGGDSRLVRLI